MPDDKFNGDLGGAASLRARQVDPFLAAKLHPPHEHEDWVERQRLLARLDEATRRPIVLISAPAGYGKTTLVAQWLARNQGLGANAWVALDAGDNDPARFWTHVAAALERVGCVLSTDLTAFMAANDGELAAGIVPKLLGALASMPDDIVILLDDFQCVANAACRAQIGFLIENLPSQVHLVIISRADPGLRLGRLRASGMLAEIRAEELCFSVDEVASLLAVEGVKLPVDGVAALLESTEGWAAGLYLAALALSGRTNAEAVEFVQRFDGTDRFVGEYFAEEVLSGLSERVRDLILKASIVDRFCASLCDFLGDTTDAASNLHDLERQNLFLVPLDDDRQWFRFHHLFSAVARSQLEVVHPESLSNLHDRAAEWFTTHGHIDDAITHLLAAGRPGDAASLVQANLFVYVDCGRAQTVLSWLRAIGPDTIASHPAAGVAAAWMAALEGDSPALAQHLEDLGSVSEYGPLPDMTHSVESSVAMIDGMFGYGGPLQMMASARRAIELETDGRSMTYAMAQRSLGHAAYVLGDLESALPPLTNAAHSEAALAVVRLVAMSEHSLASAELGRHELSQEMAERAMDIVDQREMYAMPEASLAFTALGQAQATAGKLRDAMATLEQGWAMRRKFPAIGPWPTIHHLVVMSRVAVEAGDLAMARRLLDELGSRLDRFSDGMSAMQARAAVVRSALRSRLGQDAWEESLTDRELSVLRLLQGTLTLPEIARELFLSSNTVKTHTQAIYRKLGAHSRTDAVMIARRQNVI